MLIHLFKLDGLNYHFSALYNSLCGGKLRSGITHPNDPNSMLFLLFDSTHNLKNIYNNWLKRRQFDLPSGHAPLIPAHGIKSASFQHLIQLHAREESMILKVGHKLRKAALNPSNIQKTSPQLALCK